MPDIYTPPTVDDILLDLRNSVKAEVAGTDPWIWPNNLVPLLKAFAQALRAAYLRLGFIHLQAYASTAEAEYLDYHGIDAGGLTRNPATFAQGYVSVPAVLGSVVADSILLARSDGVQYAVVGTTTAIKTPMSVFVRAIEAGELGNTDVGGILTSVSPIPGITAAFTVSTGGLIGGREQESDDSFRQRILYRKQNPPHGGSPSEYIEWVMTGKTGATRVFPKRATPQPGSATIYFMMDGVGTGVPTTDDVNEVLALLQQLAPEDAEVIVAAPTTQVVDVTVTGLVPDTPEMRDSVTNEIKAMFYRRAEPASATASETFAKAWLEEACAMAPKWRRSKITVPADDVVIATPGVLPILGTVSFA